MTLYPRLFLERLQPAFDNKELVFCGKLACFVEPAAFARHLEALRNVDLVVYAKRPFGGPEQVLHYLGPIRIVSRSPTVDSSPATTAASDSAGRIIAPTTNPK